MPWLFAADEHLGWVDGTRYNLAAIRRAVADVAGLRKNMPVDAAAAGASTWAAAAMLPEAARCAGGTKVAFAPQGGRSSIFGCGGGCGCGGCGGG